ncbi:MAG: serine hydrolase [Phycisphaerales bacterium]|nr:serine hydrolase [Phycisphaerales bacterium]
MKREYKAVVRALGMIVGGALIGAAAQADCPPGYVLDCLGNCGPAHWVDDSSCDDGSYQASGNPIFFNCPQWGFDGGDCDPDLWRPIFGAAVPSMAALDIAMLNLMNDKDITAATMGVMKDGVVVYQRFFGWQDQARTEPLLSDTMMRVASVTKPHTAACIRALIADGVIQLNDNVFDVGQPGGGLLDIEPFDGLGHPQLANVTVDHCLRHRGGWNRNSTYGVGDLTYKEIEIKTALGQDAPPTPEQVCSWVLSQPLQHNPGATRAYSNVGFMVLGLIVEQYAGKDPVEFLHERVLAPTGVLSAEVELGRTLPAMRHASEPWYDDQGKTGLNVFASLSDLANNPDGQYVPRPDGAWCQEARVGQGGLIMTPRALLHFLDNYQTAGDNIGIPRNKSTESTSWNWFHSGSLRTGTSSIAHQWGDGYNFVAIFNKTELDSDEQSYPAIMRDTFRTMMSNGTITVPDCPPGYVSDCNDNCVPAVWLGNGVCDTDTWFGSIEADFNCAQLNWDEGDCTPCPSDLDGNGEVDINDILQVIADFGMCADPSNCPSDFDGDGYVDIDDLLATIGAFGSCF